MLEELIANVTSPWFQLAMTPLYVKLELFIGLEDFFTLGTWKPFAKVDAVVNGLVFLST